jgi:hypothetical protein
MLAKWVPAFLTQATAEHVSRAYRTALTTLVGEPTDLAVAVLHAQGALETGHFRSCWNYNAGNIKAGTKYQGEYCTIKLNEVIGGKTIWFAPNGELAGKDGPVKLGTEMPVPPGHPQTRMRAYGTLSGGVTDKIKFLTGAHWVEALKLALAGDPAGYVAAVREAGYFTALLEPYQRAVVSLTAKYLPVAQATANVQPAPPVPDDDDQLCADIAACHRFELPHELAARIRVQQDEHIEDALALARSDRDRDVSEDS